MGRLGLVIDSTARDTKKIEIGLSALKRLGYDCYMIFVNTSLDVALARNAKRDRKVPRDITIKSHKQIQANMGYLQRIFGMKNFIVIDNNKFNDDILEKSYKMVRKIVKKPIQNYTAKMWLKKELEKRQIKEDINIPIKVGDVVKGGKFKNKSITVKKIGKNDKGDITINDKPLLKVRIPSFKEFAEKAPNTADAMKRYRAGKAGFTDKAHLKAKGLIPRADGTKRKSDKYK
jgi:predicted kinase